jgi:2-polyprenyl-6-hydroxyphenyl methylase/3-demethylubiquinone-9 3-methyltransferase
MPDSCGWYSYSIIGGKGMDEKKAVAFNFGTNWQQFSDNSLDDLKFKEAFNSLDKLIGHEKIKGSNFLDIGCGSGIFAIAASLAGAKKVVGINISTESITASNSNKTRFAGQNAVDFFHKSIFENDVLQLGQFDIVYSWGVLHHTGDMWRAIDIASQFVSPESLFVISIYNRHWSCGTWKIIKRSYNTVPAFIQRLMIYAFFAIIAIAKLIVTRRNPFKKKKRGMSFYYDVVDWIGGYPYEYAGKDEVINHVKRLGFRCIKFVKSEVPTG